MRAYALPPAISAEDYGFYSADLLDHLESEARDYLAGKVNEVKQKGVENVTSVVNIGYGAEEIITLGRHTPDNFIAMSHPWPVGHAALGFGKRDRTEW